MNETTRSVEDQNCKHDLARKEASDAEILKTYSTGLLALCLAGSAPIYIYVALLHSLMCFVIVHYSCCFLLLTFLALLNAAVVVK